MDKFVKSIRIKIAGRVFEIQAFSPSMERQMLPFLTDEPPDYIVSADENPEDAEQEWIDIYCRIARFLLNDNTLLFHGSCIALDGTGYLFTGPKGAGKSTHSKLWMERFGERALMINDDKPLLRITDNGGVIAYGTPWAGKENLYSNMSVPLKAIAFVNQNKINSIKMLEKEEAFPILFEETYRPIDNIDAMDRTLDLLNDLLSQVNLYSLNCNMHQDAVQVAYETMSR